ncbi:MAG: NAD-dependent epimerase/dehydratase family protein, partial [Cetobacterium sp.]
MIIVTGAAGFIGSAYIWKLNEMGRNDILAVDKLRTEEKWLNLRKRDYADWCDRDELFDWLKDEKNASKVTAVLHMGAISATTERDGDLLMKNNYEYSKKLWDFCSEREITYVYASSAATYGAGEQGYSDEVSVEELKKLMPLNKYGYSKKFFDDWAFKQETAPKQWIGAKFFNVYGPQEY